MKLSGVVPTKDTESGPLESRLPSTVFLPSYQDAVDLNPNLDQLATFTEICYQKLMESHSDAPWLVTQHEAEARALRPFNEAIVTSILRAKTGRRDYPVKFTDKWKELVPGSLRSPVEFLQSPVTILQLPLLLGIRAAMSIRGPTGSISPADLMLRLSHAWHLAQDESRLQILTLSPVRVETYRWFVINVLERFRGVDETTTDQAILNNHFVDCLRDTWELSGQHSL